MRLFAALTLLASVASAASCAIHGPFRSATGTSLLPALQLRDLQVNNANTSTLVGANGDLDLEDPPDDPWALDPNDEEDEKTQTFAPEQQEAIWCKAKSRGAQLVKAMMMNDQEAATMLSWPYTQSQWDGDLKPELRKWGYKDNYEGVKEIDAQCDFDNTHEMGDAFKDLKVDSRSAGQGGPNHCFYVEHMNGPTIIRDEDGELPFPEDQYYNADGKNFRVTQAYAKVGINPTDGLVYFIHRQSPEDAAEEHWGRGKPKSEELPALRSSSDIAWGMWNRVASGSQKLNYFMALSVVNQETQYIMKCALQQYNIDEVPAWPGKDFEFVIKNAKPKESDLLEMEAALALLGSSNGLGAGYFIIQHRRQLGWKYIWKVKIWMAGTGVWANPNILFYVSNRVFEGPEQQRRLDEQLKNLHIAQRRKRDLDEAVEAGVMHKNKDGKNVIREHVIIAKW